jgi:broad specificity phosphatase PhoE
VTSVRLVLWRHGLTGWNAENRFQGQLDPPLSETGLAEAEKAAELLAAMSPALLVSSDLQRAQQTAGALADRTGLPIHTDERLRERHWGDWQGKTHAELAEHDSEAFAMWQAGRQPSVNGREGPDDVRARVAAAIRNAVTRVSHVTEATVILVSHGGAIRYGVAELLRWPEELARTVSGLNNCHWAQLRSRPVLSNDARDEWVLSAYNVGAATP